jgi:hypothetical protein
MPARVGEATAAARLLAAQERTGALSNASRVNATYIPAGIPIPSSM